MPKEEVIEHINSYGNIVWSGGLHINYVIVHQWQGKAGLVVQYGEPGKAQRSSCYTGIIV